MILHTSDSFADLILEKRLRALKKQVSVLNASAVSAASEATQALEASVDKSLEDYTPALWTQAYSWGDHSVEGYAVENTPAAFGGAVNYTEFEADGTLKMNGDATVYADIVCPVIVRATGTNRPGLQTFIGNILQYQFDVNDYAEIEAVELPHSWKEGSELEIHVHWATGGLNDATARAVKWEIEYAYAGMGNGTYTTTATDSAETAIPAATADRTLFYTQIDTFTPTGFGIGTQLVMRLRRIAATGTAPAADPFVLDIGVHYEMDTLGSRVRASK